MSCKELIEKFKILGDKINCNYITKKCTFNLDNTTCNFDNKDLDNLIDDTYLKPYYKISYIDSKIPIQRLHRYQIKNTKNIIIELDKEKKEWYDLFYEKNNYYK